MGMAQEYGKKMFMKPKIIYSFIISTFATLFVSALFPHFKPIFYAPFLVISFFNTTFIISLWLSCLGGLMVDLLSSSHMGLYALVYTLCTAIFYRQKKYFKDTPTNIALFTILISLAYTVINVILLFIFDKGINISLLWFLTDFIGLSLIDGIYAFVCFAFPITAYELLKNKKLFAINRK